MPALPGALLLGIARSAVRIPRVIRGQEIKLPEKVCLAMMAVHVRLPSLRHPTEHRATGRRPFLCLSGLPGPRGDLPPNPSRGGRSLRHEAPASDQREPDVGPAWLSFLRPADALVQFATAGPGTRCLQDLRFGVVRSSGV